MNTSDDAEWGMNSGRTPSPDALDYNFWMHRLTVDQRIQWREITQGMENKDRIAHWKKLICFAKAQVAQEMGLTLIRPAANYGQWGKTDVLVCQDWNAKVRKQVVFSPESGFVCLQMVIRSLP